jgi:hypothetical protein
MAERQKAVEDGLDPIDLSNVQLEKKAILTRDAVALDDRGRPLGELGHLRELTGAGPYADISGHGQPERSWIQVQAVTGNDARLPQALDALGDGGCRHAELPGELRCRQARIGLQFLEETEIHVVEEWTTCPEDNRGLRPSL